MSSCYGKNVKISIFGQSHSEAIGVVIDGLPWGFQPDMQALSDFMTRRAPGQNELGTARKEADRVEILSGLVNGKTCGAPLAAAIKNTNAHSADYENIMDIPRPGHADFTAHMKFGGCQDVSGGGHFSGRLTAPLCIAGAICKQILEREGICIGAHIDSVAGISDDKFNPMIVSAADFERVLANGFPVLNAEAGEKMRAAILAAKAEGDSVGGTVECAVTGLPAGLGDPMFDGMENRIAQIVFGIPAIKGIEFGNGFEAAALLGSENNDPYRMANGKIVTEGNNHGGILGGITSGMPLLFRVAVKPTPSISKEQNSVSMSKNENAVLTVKGRHDPCIVQRVVPCVEAAAAIAVLDAWLDYKMYR